MFFFLAESTTDDTSLMVGLRLHQLGGLQWPILRANPEWPGGVF